MTPTKEELLRLRDLTRMTGTITHIQKHQLQLWPKVILSAAKAELEFDPESNVLTVDVEGLDYKSVMEGAMPADSIVTVFSRRMSKFDEAVKWLLGEEYGVVVRMKGKVLGNFPPRVASIAAHPPEKK